MPSSPSLGTYKVISDSIEKPDIDDRLYRLIELPNKLQVLLISDATTDKSAAALDVNVGSFHDPRSLPGLAHFCEHLLFMGTKKYPSENDYSSYLSKNSGSSNAFTASEHTNYFFEVANDAMEGALDRFSQFFISPLFDPACKDREIKAVDSENKKNLQSDLWRLYQLSKSQTNPKHPFNGFSTGNKVTLGDEPLKQGLDVRDELLKFHEKYYSSNIMKLVILSNEELDTLTKWAVDMFSPVVNKNTTPSFFLDSPFEGVDYTGKFLKVKPIMDTRSLRVTFPVPDTTPFWESRPEKYLSHLIGHESEGSLLFNFKKLGWANSLSSGCDKISPGFGSFLINVDLTPEGLKNYKEVLKHIFVYIRMLNIEGPQEWIYNELREQAITGFKFKQKSGASTTAYRIAGRLHELEFYDTSAIDPLISASEVPSFSSVPPKKLFSASIPTKYDAEAINKLLSYLKPSNFRAMLISKEGLEEEDKSNIVTEKWYGTEYTLKDLDATLMSELNATYNGTDKTYDGSYSLPEKNKFIATDFSLVEKPKDEREGVVYPKLVSSNKTSKIWFKVNTKLGGPRSTVTLKFNLPGSTSTPLNSTLLSLFIELLDDELNSISYLAYIAGLSHHFDNARGGMSLTVSGYSHKQDNLIDSLAETLSRFTQDDKMWDETREKRFEVIREKTLRSLKNFGYSVPYNQVGPMISALLNEDSWLIDDQISCYNAITFRALKSFVANLFNICFIEMLVVGNFNKQQAFRVNELIESKLSQSVPFTQSQFTRGRTLDLPQGREFHFVRKNDDPENVNSCTEIFIQLGHIANDKERVIAELIAQILHEPFFDRLRTKEQLGYVVFSGLRQTRTTFGLRLLVQSERPTPYLLERIDKFMTKMGYVISKMTVEEFKKQVGAVVSKKSQKAKNLNEEKSRFWNRIATGFYDFDRREVDVEILNGLELDQLIKYYHEKVLDSTANGKLVVHLQSQVTPVIPLKSDLTAMISNFLYDYAEFDDLEFSLSDLETLIEGKVGESGEVTKNLLISILHDEDFVKLIPNLGKEDELISKILSRSDYSEISLGEAGELIENCGDWKSQIPLTAAPFAQIPKKYLDDELLESKL